MLDALRGIKINNRGSIFQEIYSLGMMEMSNTCNSSMWKNIIYAIRSIEL